MMEYEGFSISNHEKYPCLKITRIGKGALPQTLQGLFTSGQSAKASIDAYIGSGVKKNAKSIETSGG